MAMAGRRSKLGFGWLHPPERDASSHGRLNTTLYKSVAFGL